MCRGARWQNQNKNPTDRSKEKQQINDRIWWPETRVCLVCSNFSFPSPDPRSKTQEDPMNLALRTRHRHLFFPFSFAAVVLCTHRIGSAASNQPEPDDSCMAELGLCRPRCAHSACWGGRRGCQDRILKFRKEKKPTTRITSFRWAFLRTRMGPTCFRQALRLKGRCNPPSSTHQIPRFNGALCCGHSAFLRR